MNNVLRRFRQRHGYDKNKTEFEIMNELDAGHKKYKLEIVR